MTKSKRKTNYTKTVGPILLAALLLLPILPLTAADTTSEADRIIPSSGTCGMEVQVAIDLDWGPARDQATLMIEENLPSGWSVTSISHGGDLSTTGKAKWFLSDPTIETVTYRLAIPMGVVGTFTFDGVYRDDTTSGPSSTIAGDTHLAVACPEAHVTREELTAVNCGQSLTVRLAVDWHSNGDTRIMVEETPPMGWTIVSASEDGNLSTEGKVKWWLDDPSVTMLSYQVTVPSEAQGVHQFHGVYRDESMGDQANAVVAGDETIDVSCGASVTRSGLDGPRECQETFTVTLMLDWTGTTSLQIEETVPSGWTIGQPSHGGNLGTPGSVKWFLNDDSTGAVTYQVTVPQGSSTTASFSGIFRHDGLGPGSESPAILGQDTVNTSCPGDPGDPGAPEEAATVSRSTPGTAHPQALPVMDTSFLVTLNLNWKSASTATVEEILPGPHVSVSSISNGGTTSNGRIVWSLTDPSVTSVSYRLSVADTSDLDVFGERTLTGTILDNIRQGDLVGPGPVTGSSSLLVSHRFDTEGDCIFGDDELFAVIDAWKAAGSTDNELFSGIDAWKLRPGSYC